MSDAPTFGRYAEMPVDRMTPEQREGYRFLVEGPRGRLPGPYKVWVHNPKLLRAAAPLGQHFTPGQSSLSEREREIAVLVITSRWQSAYPTAAHEKRGKEVGLPAAAVEAIVANLPTSFSDAREQAVYEVAMALAGRAARPSGSVRPRRRGARARERHRHDRPDGLLHLGLADDELLCRAGRKPGPGPLSRRAMAHVRITPLHPSLGAEVAGVDLSAPIDEPTRNTLTRALADHLALVFHDQSLTPAQYLAAASVFGPPMEQHYSQHNMPDFPLIGLIWHRNGQQPAEMWHTDHTNRECPPAATILYGEEIPSAGGGTSVANMRAAYLALPEDERRRLESLITFNGLDGHADTRPEDRDKYGKPIEHPMVRTHPVHGSRAVYFHISKATHIDGMTPEASKAYMRDLLDRMIRPEIVYHHAWRKGDVLVIDDRATMHRAHGDYDRSQSRVLWRIIVEGDRPRLV